MFQSCTISRTWVLRQNVPLKMKEFSMERPFWCPSEGHKYGGHKPLETSGVYFGYVETFRLYSAELANIRLNTSLNILAVQTSKTQGELTFHVRESTYVSQQSCLCHARWKNLKSSNCFIFKTEHVIELKTSKLICFKNVFYLMKVKTENWFFIVLMTSRENQ